jgi:NAD(P)-dependent dehydrogenase (short-subunit alcohol dehydrogenase family)
MVKFLATELLPDGIRVNSLAPGLIRTKLSKPLWKNPKYPTEAIGEAHQIGSVAALICSKDDGGFMNGEIYIVNGGFSKM